VNLLLDTHIILWSASEPERLPEKIAEELEDPVNDLWFSPISVWEVLLLAERGRISVEGEIERSVRDLFRDLPLKEAPLNIEVAIESRNVDIPHQDPVDRFLAATAIIYDLILVTADRGILPTKGLQILDAS